MRGTNSCPAAGGRNSLPGRGSRRGDQMAESSVRGPASARAGESPGDLVGERGAFACPGARAGTRARRDSGPHLHMRATRGESESAPSASGFSPPHMRLRLKPKLPRPVASRCVRRLDHLSSLLRPEEIKWWGPKCWTRGRQDLRISSVSVHIQHCACR